MGPTQAPFATRPTPAGKGSVVGATKYLGGQEVFQPTKASKYGGQIVGSPLPVEQVSLDRNVQPAPYVPIAKRKPKPAAKPTASAAPVTLPRVTRLPPAPPVRIDTCIVGNDATCGKHEVCRTHLGVSSCFCKPGYGRKNHRLVCKSKHHHSNTDINSPWSRYFWDRLEHIFLSPTVDNASCDCDNLVGGRYSLPRQPAKGNHS